MRRCPHSVYWPENDPKPFYCSLCCPDGLALRAPKPKKARKKPASPFSVLDSDNKQPEAA
jgi:hypothetical protein